MIGDRQRGLFFCRMYCRISDPIKAVRPGGIPEAGAGRRKKIKQGG